MTKLRNMLIAVIAITSLTTSAFSGTFGLGVSGSLISTSASGTETEGTAAETGTKDATAGNTAAIGSIFAEYSFGDGGFTIGFDHVPGEADVNNKAISRTEVDTSIEGNEGTQSADVTRKGQATIDNANTYYAEVRIHSGLYVKAGITQLDLTTAKMVGDKSYGSTTIDGSVFGIGFKQDIGTNGFYKVEGTTRSYDTMNLTEKNQSTNSAANTIKADLDATMLTFALGYKF